MIEENLMQKIAEENNLSETVFAVKKDKTYEIRWFTPTVEVHLCGHATLATTFVLFNYFNIDDTIIHFYSHRSGNLSVESTKKESLVLNFPKSDVKKTVEHTVLNKTLGNPCFGDL